MTFATVAVRRGVLAGLALTSLGLTACGSDDGGGSSSSPTQSVSQSSGSSNASPTVALSAGAPSSASSAPAAGGGASGTAAKGDAKACSDLVQVKKINKDFDGVGKDINKGRTLIVVLKAAANKLAADAPSSIAAPAKNYASAVSVLADYVNRASSVDQLHTESKTDPKLQAALTKLSSATGALQSYATNSC